MIDSEPAIDPEASVALDVTLGRFVVIEARARIAAGSVIGHGVVIRRDTVVGAGLPAMAMPLLPKASIRWS